MTVRSLALIVALAPAMLAAQRVTRLVTHDITAVDKRGSPVADLTAAELRVTDVGRPQVIAYFRRGQDVSRQTELTRGYSNAGYGTFPHATVVLLDLLNTNIELAGPEWDQIARSLQRAEGDGDTYFYVLQKSGALFPVRGLPESWMEAGMPAGHWTREILPQFEEMRKQIPPPRPDELDLSKMRPGSPESDRATRNIQEATQTAREELTMRLQPVPGAKRIVWVGPMWNPSFLKGAAARLLAPEKGPEVEITEIGGHKIDAVPVYYVFRSNPHGAIDVEQTIAGALADTQKGYRIGYEPSGANWDGKEHEVRITCRRPGVTVWAVAKYTAVKPVDVEDDQRQIVPDLVAASPFDASAIRFHATREDGGFDVVVDARDVVFARDSCALAAAAIRYDAAGEWELPQDAMVLRDGVRFRIPAAMPGAGGRWRLVVYDRATKSFGTLTVPEAAR